MVNWFRFRWNGFFSSSLVSLVYYQSHALVSWYRLNYAGLDWLAVTHILWSHFSNRKSIFISIFSPHTHTYTQSTHLAECFNDSHFDTFCPRPKLYQSTHSTMEKTNWTWTFSSTSYDRFFAIMITIDHSKAADQWLNCYYYCISNYESCGFVPLIHIRMYAMLFLTIIAFFSLDGTVLHGKRGLTLNAYIQY